MELKRKPSAGSVECSLAKSRSLVKEQLRTAGKVSLKKKNDVGKVKKVYKYLKIVHEVSVTKEFEYDNEQK